jgi:creatinine amidohydrolase
MKENWKLQNITLLETKNKKFEVAVIPIGATEPHNYHLPHGSDLFHADYVASESCKIAFQNGASIIQLPTIPYGSDANLLDFPLAINVYQKTLNLLLKDILDSLTFHNIFKIVILNGHGGNDFKPFLRDLFPDCKAFVCYIDWWKVANDKYKEIFEYPDDHSGEMETSVNLVMNPDLVHLENAADGKCNETQFEGINKGWVSISRRWSNLTESSGVGYPFKATKEKGEKYLKITIERISKFLTELSKAPLTEKFPFV